jgi:hypothetical protein
MKQTPTFRCINDYPALGAGKNHIIKMSPKSVEEIDKDERFKGWRKSFEEVGLEEELSLINT